MSQPVDSSWKRLGEMLVRRRIELDPAYANRQAFVTARGVNYRTIGDIEAGRRENYEPGTIAALEVAYGVAAGSIGRALAGGELEPLPAEPTPAGPPRLAAPLAPVPAPPSRAAKIAALRKIAGLIPGATETELAILDAMTAQLAEDDEDSMLAVIWQAPSGHRPGELASREERVAMLIRWIAADPRDDPGGEEEPRETGTA